ncbi:MULTISPECIES: ead/Ea22-like family protein [unclassified Escherichia]|nr:MULTISPECIES: ead/Ea22-like family protein [unclassified Escherichia]
MNKIDYQALRDAAERAIPAPKRRTGVAAAKRAAKKRRRAKR